MVFGFNFLLKGDFLYPEKFFFVKEVFLQKLEIAFYCGAKLEEDQSLHTTPHYTGLLIVSKTFKENAI